MNRIMSWISPLIEKPFRPNLQKAKEVKECVEVGGRVKWSSDWNRPLSEEEQKIARRLDRTPKDSRMEAVLRGESGALRNAGFSSLPTDRRAGRIGWSLKGIGAPVLDGSGERRGEER